MAFLTSKHIKEKYIFVLLGPSGSGKTTYGQSHLELACQKDVNMFLSTGLELRKQNVMSAWREPDMTAVKDFCHKLINETFENFKRSETHQMLILDTVKDLEGAEYIDAQAKKYDLQITRALLFSDIGADDLHKNWISRDEDRDIFHGSAHAYLRKWNIKSNDLLNYYKKSNLLATISRVTRPLLSPELLYIDLYYAPYPSLLDILEWPSKDNQVFPSPPNNLCVLLTNSVKIKDIFTELLSILKVNQHQFTLPASFVHCHRDVTWVTNPARYHVTAKADGVRCLLMKIQDGTYLITRKNEIYPCCITDKLPDNTVLDGELLPSTSISEIHPKISKSSKSSVFLVFDVLAVSGDVLWKWPFTVRQESLCKLTLSKDIAAVMKQASTDDKFKQSIPVKENNLNKFVVNCVIKDHKPSTPDEVLEYLGVLSQLSYPCDGLVFTPNTAYVFGPDPLLFKWQSKDSVQCDILLSDLESGKRKCAVHFASNFLNKREVMECQWNQLEKAWDPLFVRWDKSAPNSDETIDHVEKMCQQPYTEEHLIADLTEEMMRNFNELKDTTNTTAPSVVNHPSAGYSFDDLYAKLTELVQLGCVEKRVDSGTSLEILNYSTFVSNPLVSLCRGLVLHPDSKTIVTKPFIRFFEDVSECGPNEDVEATIKYDGSLGIAFLWNGEVMVTTRRRMDSEQAMWAKQWIKDHCNLTKFQAGYTYLFEIICQNNTVIVNYLFEGLVLLAITDESGHELSYEEVLHCAKAIGFFMVTPRVTASYSEVLWYCGGIDFTMQESKTPNLPPFVSGALPVNRIRQEGWVVKFKDGRRLKIIYSWWKEVSEIAHLAHPQIVWLLVKHGKIKEILAKVPSHFRVEIHRMIQAFGRKFMETVRHVEEHLIASSLKSRKVPIESGNKVCGVWRYSVFSFPVTDESENSEDDTSEVGSVKLSEQTEQLCLDEDKSIVSDKTTSKDKDEHVPDSGVTITSEVNDFVKLVRKVEPYFEVGVFPNSCYETEFVKFSPVYNRKKYNYLRLPVLDYICPTSPVLDGYEPSDNFKQTWCKGWKTLPINQIQFIQEVLQENHSNPPFLQLPVEVIVLLLEFLDGISLAVMTQVCMQLRNIVKSSQTLRKKIAMAEEKHILDMHMDMHMDMYRRSSWSDDEYPSRYSSTDSIADCWGGYGSF